MVAGMAEVTSGGQLLERLRRHYLPPGPLPGGIFVDEVGTNDWNAGGRRCDALYVGFTGTSGRHLIGHELKTSRADWRAELAKPGKADLWADQCHAWYVVAPSREIVPVEELPADWGLLVVNPRTTVRLDVVKRAVTHGDRQPSWQVVRSVMSRYDTLRAQAIAGAGPAAEAKVAEELYRLRARERAARQGISDELTETVKAVAEGARTRLRTEGGGYVAREDLVDTLVDLTRTRKAVQQLTGRAAEILRALDTLQAGMNPQLAKWADEAENLRTLLH